MRAKVGRWGNSLAVRIPRDLAEKAGLEVRTEVELSLEGNRVLVEPTTRRGWSLRELLARVTEENRHQELDLGSLVGDEVWWGEQPFPQL